MGLTIHYRGKLAHTEDIDEFVEELLDIVETMKWPHSVLDDDWTKPATAELVFTEQKAEICGELALKGISFIPHPECEGVPLFFDAEGNLRDPITVMMLLDGTLKPEQAWLSVKTQYAPLEIHITVVNLLKYLKKRYIPDLEVHDEGKYWETNDLQMLQTKVDLLNEKLQEIAQVLDATEKMDVSGYSPEEMADFIEKLLKNRWGEER
jgi:hypothetical protein